MTGFCGWLGPPGDGSRPEAVAAAMSGGLPGFDGYRTLSAANGRGGMVVVAPPQTGHFHADDRFLAALHGYPRWTCERLAGVAKAGGHGAALIEAYRDRGAGLLEVLDGAFSLAIVDLEERKALIAIDRLGIETVCYGFPAGGGIVFGTRTDSVRAFPAIGSTVTVERIHDYLFCWRIPAPATIYREQSKLLAGQYLLCTGEREPRPEFYWRMPYREHEAPDPAEAEEELRSLLRQAVRRSTDDAAPAPTGAFLSGGLDSSVVVGFLGETSGAAPRAFTVSFPEEGYDELSYARVAAESYGADHLVFEMAPKHIYETLPAVAVAFDEPFGNASSLPTHCCARLAKVTGVDVLLAGDGGDEIFGGNSRYVEQNVYELYGRLPEWLRTGVIEPLVGALPGNDSISLFRKARNYVQRARTPLPDRLEAYNHFMEVDVAEVFDPSVVGELTPDGPLRYMRDAYERTGSSSILQRMMQLDLQIALADSDFRKVNIACELAGVRVLYPFADRDLVEFSARIPPEMLVNKGELRSFYKRALENFLPREVLTKPKHGFGLPVDQWFTTFPPLRELAGDCLTDLRRRHYLRPSFLDDCLGVVQGTVDSVPVGNIYDLVTLELWLQAHADK